MLWLIVVVNTRRRYTAVEGAVEGAAVLFLIALTRTVYSLGLVRPLNCDQPETLTQGYYARVNLMAVNAAPRHRLVAPVNK